MPHLCSNGLLFVFHVEEIVLEPAVVIHRVDDCWLLPRRTFLGVTVVVGFICAWRG